LGWGTPSAVPQSLPFRDPLLSDANSREGHADLIQPLSTYFYQNFLELICLFPKRKQFTSFYKSIFP
jgi:hypothetical protein